MSYLSGHGATLAMEIVGGAAGTFVPVLQVEVDLGNEHVRQEDVVKVHDSGVPYKVVAPIQELSDLTISGVYDEDLNTLGPTTGLRAQFLGVGGTPGTPNNFGIKQTGPSSSGTGNDEVIGSGYIKSFKFMYPTEGARRFEAVFTFSGPQKIDGTVYS